MGNNEKLPMSSGLLGRSAGMEQAKTLRPRNSCRYIRVNSGDACAALVSRCGISSTDLHRYNSEPNLCSMYVCCSPGQPFKEPTPEPPTPSRDGTCAIHLISDNDTCDKIAKLYGVTIRELEGSNKGKT